MFVVLGAVLLCVPSVAWAEPLDTGFLDIPELSESIQEPELTNIINDLEIPEPIEASFLSKDYAQAGKELLISIGSTSGITLNPGQTYQIYLDDTLLATHPADQNGQLFVQVSIPADTPPGTHTIQVITPDQVLQKTIQIINI